MESKASEIEPSPKLRQLRDRMETLQLEARELETFNFDSNHDNQSIPCLRKMMPQSLLVMYKLPRQIFMNNASFV